MKIAHIICTFPPYKGGMGNSVYGFAKAQSARGHDVTVLTPDHSGSARGKSNEGFRLRRLKPLFKSGNAAVLPQIFFLLGGYDIIHLHYPFYGTAAIVLLRKMLDGKKMKLVVHYHMDTASGGLKGLYFRLARAIVLPLMVRSADAVICSSIDYLEHSDASRHYGQYRDKFSAVPFGVDMGRFEDDEGYDDEDEAPHDEKYILFVGGLDRAHYFKGLENLLRVFAKFPAEKKYYLSVVGSGDMHSRYAQLAEELGISAKVRFFGSVSNKDLPAYYHKADVLVLPSVNKGEAFGMVLLEAMASGKPVVASRLPGVRSVFTDGVEGFLAEAGDIDDLADKIARILEDKQLARKMGEAGRKTAREKYSWEKAAESLDKIYSGL